jgi:hypothetical protein
MNRLRNDISDAKADKNLTMHELIEIKDDESDTST